MDADAIAFEDSVIGRFSGFVTFVEADCFKGEGSAIPGDGGGDVIDGEDGVGIEEHGVDSLAKRLGGIRGNVIATSEDEGLRPCDPARTRVLDLCFG